MAKKITPSVSTSNEIEEALTPIYFEKVGKYVSGTYRGLPVYRDNDYQSMIEPNTAWMCRLRLHIAPHTNNRCYLAIPVDKVDVYTYLGMSEKNKEEIAKIFAKVAPEVFTDKVTGMTVEIQKDLEDTKKELEDTKNVLEDTKKELEDTKKELEDTKNNPSTVVATVPEDGLAIHYSAVIKDMSEQVIKMKEDLDKANSDLFEAISDRDKAVKERDEEIAHLKTEREKSEEAAKASESEKIEALMVQIKERDEEIAHLKTELECSVHTPLGDTDFTLVEKEVLESPWFDKNRYSVHVNFDKRILSIRPNATGTAVCQNHRIKLVGFDAILPFTGKTVLKSTVDDQEVTIAF